MRLGLKPAAPILFCSGCQDMRQVTFFGYAQGSTHLPYERRVRKFRCQTCQTILSSAPEAEPSERSRR